MFQEKRPTCVTVIGWAWIVLGGIMCFSAVMGLFASSMMSDLQESRTELPLMFRIFPLIAGLQACIGVFGAFAGVQFLRLKRWSRASLEGLTWLLLIFLVAFGVFWVFKWLSVSPIHDSPGFGWMGLVMGVGVTLFYAVPLAVMLKYLRGIRVRSAFDLPNQAL